MKKLVFSEIKKYTIEKQKLKLKNFRFFKHRGFATMYFVLKHFDYSEKKFKQFKKENLKHLKKIAKTNDYMLFVENYRYFHNDLKHSFEIVIKKINFSPVKLNTNKLYHLTYKKNRKNILKQGLIKQSFFKSRWKHIKSYYYKPTIFLVNDPAIAKFLFYEEYKKIIDVFEIDLDKLNKHKFYYDCNMISSPIKCAFMDLNNEDKFYMTFQNIPPEAIELFDSYKVKKEF